MSRPKSIIDVFLARGGAFVSMVAKEVSTNPAYVRTMMGAIRGGELLNRAVERALKSMNVPSRPEFDRVIARVEALERELAEARAAQAAPPPAKPKRKAARKRPARAASSRRRKAPASGA